MEPLELRAHSPLSGDELGSDGDCAVHSPEPAPPSADGAKGKPYTRRAKPPYSYIALIAMAIRESASGRLTLAEINDFLMRSFAFFRGSYTGWRNSVRHNLSLNDCFLKVLRDPSRPWGKDNYWMLNPHSEYTFADGVFRRRRKRIAKRCGRQPEARAKFSSSFSIDSILNRPRRGGGEAAAAAAAAEPCCLPDPGPHPGRDGPRSGGFHIDFLLSSAHGRF